MKQGKYFWISIAMLLFVIFVKLFLLHIGFLAMWIFYIYKLNIVIYMVIGIILVFIFWNFFNTFKKNFFNAAIPVFISVLAVLFLSTNMIDSIWVKGTYWFYIDDYKEVVEFVESGEIVGDGLSWTLPAQYSYLSAYGDILVDQKGDNLFVMFLVFSGVLDNFSGYVYSSMDIEPDSSVLGGDFKKISKKEENWYWAVSY